MTITIKIATLRQLGACADQLKLFRSTFGSAVTFDSLSAFEAACLTHHFDYNWAARHLLSVNGSAEYNRQVEPLAAECSRQADLLWAEYEHQTGPLWAEYKRQTGPLWAEYEHRTGPLWAEYNRQKEPLWAEYKRQKEPLWAEYEHQTGPLFARLYWAENTGDA